MNSVKFYFRSISRRKLYSFINITGLAFGISFIILIGQFLYTELSVNREINDVNNLYRLVDTESSDYNVDYRINEQIADNIPAVEKACIINQGSTDLNIGDKYFVINNMVITDPNFFSIFNCKFISGNAQNALNSINNVVFTESTAMKIFGSTNITGKTVRLGHIDDFLITAVVKDLPENISFGAEIFVSYLNSINQRLSYKQNCFGPYDGKDDSNCRYPFNVVVKLYKDHNITDTETSIASLHEINKNLYPSKVKLTPLKSNYFNLDYQDGDFLHGNIELLNILSAIGIIVLLLAVINFINLTTASFRKRMTEIGIKKCLGAGRNTLVNQLLTESFFTCLISSAFGIGLSRIFLPYFNQYIDKDINLLIFSNIEFLLLFAGFIMALSLLTGAFPAITLSGFSPLQLFRLKSFQKTSGKLYRGPLIMLQFSIAIILITGILFVNRQIDFVKHKELGFNTERLIKLNINHTMTERYDAIMNRLKEYHGIKSITKTLGVPGEIVMWGGDFKLMSIDSTTLKTFGFKLIKGRDLLPGDINKSCLVNAAAMNHFGDKEIIGQKVDGAEVVGVVSDFHFSSLYNKIEPLALLYNPQWGANNITIRVKGNIGQALEYIKSVMMEVSPEYPLQYSFYDEYFASMYKQEENLASLISIFSLLAVVISCLGIFGLSVFQSEQRIKEIGIRKVLGASISEVIILLTKNISRWVIFSNIIAVPVAYYFLDKWLQSFAYKVSLSWWVFVLAGIIALAIAIITISVQAIKAATANPVDALKYE